MNEQQQVIGIEVAALKEMMREAMREVMREELSKLEQRLVAAQSAKVPIDDRLFTKDVAKLLGITRQTVTEYRKKEILPPPQLTPGGRPYWNKEQVIEAIKTSGFAYKYEL